MNGSLYVLQFFPTGGNCNRWLLRRTWPLDEMPISRNIKKAVLTLWTCSLIFFWYSFLQTGTSRLRIDLTSVICIGPWSFIKGQKLMLYRWNLPLSFLWHFWQFYAQYLTMVMLGTLKRSQSKPTPVQSYSNSKEGYPDNDRRSCFISHLLGSFLYISHTLVSRPCKIQSGFYFQFWSYFLYLGPVRYKAIYFQFSYIS